MAEKGLMTKELEDLAKKGLDFIIPTTGVKEIATDAIINMIVPTLDNNVLDNIIPDKIKIPIREAGQMVLDGADDEAVSFKLSEALESLTSFEESDIVKRAYRSQIEALICWVKVGLEFKNK